MCRAYVSSAGSVHQLQPAAWKHDGGATGGDVHFSWSSGETQRDRLVVDTEAGNEAPDGLMVGLWTGEDPPCSESLRC